MIAALDAKVLSANPLVLTVDGFASAAECASLIEVARGGLEQATVHGKDYEIEVSQKRSNTGYWLEQTTHPATAALCLKVSVVLRIPFSNAEMMHVLHYAPGQEFKPHHDGFDLSGVGVEKVIAGGGQRLFTSIIYLNEVEAGGTTTFPELGIVVAPKPGRLLVFANTLAGTNRPCSLSRHAGEPVMRGEKWAATTWWRERPPA